MLTSRGLPVMKEMALDLRMCALAVSAFSFIVAILIFLLLQFLSFSPPPFPLFSHSPLILFFSLLLSSYLPLLSLSLLVPSSSFLILNLTLLPSSYPPLTFLYSLLVSYTSPPLPSSYSLLLYSYPPLLPLGTLYFSS